MLSRDCDTCGKKVWEDNKNWPWDTKECGEEWRANNPVGLKNDLGKRKLSIQEMQQQLLQMGREARNRK